MIVRQDGAQFYVVETGQQVFDSTVRVPDGDVGAAIDAQREFECWAKDQGLTVDLVGP